MAVVPGAGTAGVNGNNDADSGATISIVCTNGASATIKAEAGLHDAGAIRKMISGADSLAYELYTGAGRGTVLNPATIAYTGRGFATATDKIHGRITAAQLAAAKNGTYSDTVALTSDFLAHTCCYLAGSRGLSPMSSSIIGSGLALPSNPGGDVGENCQNPDFLAPQRVSQGIGKPGHHVTPDIPQPGLLPLVPIAGVV